MVLRIRIKIKGYKEDITNAVTIEQKAILYL